MASIWKNNPFFALRARIAALFATLFVAMFAVIALIQLYGIPGTGYQGLIRKQHDDVFRALNMAASLAQERLENLGYERRGDLHSLMLAKPINPEELIAALARWIERGGARKPSETGRPQ